MTRSKQLSCKGHVLIGAGACGSTSASARAPWRQSNVGQVEECQLQLARQSLGQRARAPVVNALYVDIELHSARARAGIELA